jgi:type I restriction enzyme S subunit
MSGEWREVHFSECAKRVSEVVQPGQVAGSTPYIGLEHIVEAGLRLNGHSYSSSATSAKLRFKRGDILFGKLRPYFRKVVRPAFDGVCSTDIWVVRASHGVDQSYLFYLMASEEFIVKASEGSTGTRMPRADWSYLSIYAIPLPPLPEQRRIAKILGDLDDKIELNRKMNETLEQLARALFKSWFIDFDPVRAKMEGRIPQGMDAETAALFPSRLVESELGLVPEGWEVKALGDVVECIGGGTPNTKEGLYWNGGTINWATPKDLSSLQAPLLTATERSITDAGLARVASGLLPARTLLMSSRAPVGYLAISTIPVAINQGFIAMPESTVMPSLYMLHWCNANMTEIQGRASGTTFAELSKSNFRQMRLLLPSGQLLKNFSRMVSDYYNQIETNIHQSRTLASLRDTLLPQLMRGEGRGEPTNR